MNLASAATIDVRQVPPADRHPLVFATFERLATGQSMELISDHEPRPLHVRFMSERPSAFAWDPLESGPTTWRVRLTKLEAPASGGRCCGCCGGA